jgi:hypothetical protein
LPWGASKDDTYSEEETQRRVEAALRGTFKTPPKPLKAAKGGKPEGKPLKPKDQ